MTKLEMILGVSLIGVTGVCIGAIAKSIKCIKKEQEFLNTIQEKCEDIKYTLENEEESIQDFFFIRVFFFLYYGRNPEKYMKEENKNVKR